MGAAARQASAWSQRASDGGGVFNALGNASARLAEGIERVVFQRAEGRGVFNALGNASARLAEGAERVIFQRVDTSTLKLAGLIAGFTDAVERAIFQTGVERGVARTVGGAQRRLLALEQRLGQPSVIGTILTLAVLAVIVGTR